MSENRPTSLIRRFVHPREIGDIVAFLCSPRAAVINGSCIRAEGGLVRTAF
jgi:3-oxoacyl-[acyl-carrier protein] reductase